MDWNEIERSRRVMKRQAQLREAFSRRRGIPEDTRSTREKLEEAHKVFTRPARSIFGDDND